jgi:predicted component of type VI protein secretion system
MNICIKIIAVQGELVDGPEAFFGTEGGSVGRRSDNTLVLHDPSRRVSRIHMLVSRHGQSFRVRDQGSYLPVYVNGRGIGFQREETIRPGDRIQIGDHVLHVSEAGDDDGTRSGASAAGRRDDGGLVDRDALTFEMLEARLAAAKASGGLLTLPSQNDQIDTFFDAAATQGIERPREAGIPGEQVPGASDTGKENDKPAAIFQAARRLFGGHP